MIIGALLLAIAATASADDTRWELWFKDISVPGPYRVLASFETRHDCINAIERRYVKPRGLPIQQKVESGSVMLVGPDGRGLSLLQCVPDTFWPKNTPEGSAWPDGTVVMVAPRDTVVSSSAAPTQPPVAFAAEPAGHVLELRGNASVTRGAASSPLPLTVGDPVYVEDRITAETDSIVRVALSVAANVSERAAEVPARAANREPTLGLGSNSTATIRAGLVVLESGYAVYAAPIISVGSPLVIQTENATARGMRGMRVNTDPRVPQVADGSFVTLTMVCGSIITPTTASGRDGRIVELTSGDCVQIIDDTTGQASAFLEWRGPAEHWALYRQLAGTGRWLHDYNTDTREECEAAATRHRSFGRVVECRFHTGLPVVTR